MPLDQLAAVEIDSDGLVHISQESVSERETIGRWDTHYLAVLSRVGPDTLFYDERAFDDVVSRAAAAMTATFRARH